MKLLCLGTGAADWNPEKRTPGCEWRHFCSTLVDTSLLIDPGPHIFESAEELGRPDLFEGVTDILVTHSHGDHFCTANAVKLCTGHKRALWGSFACMQKIRARFPEEAESIDFHEVKAFDRFTVGRYHVFTLPSNHSTEVPDEITFNHIISDGEKNLFYALDGAWLLRESWNAFRKTEVFDAVVLDATVGDKKGDFRIFEHNTLAMVEMMCDTFRALGIIREGTGKIYANHMARTLHTDHETLVRRLAPSGIIPCYDGMEIEI